jgi:hypothetical protein
MTFFNFIPEKTTLMILVPEVPPGVMKNKILFLPVQTKCTYRVRGADYIYHNENF